MFVTVVPGTVGLVAADGLGLPVIPDVAGTVVPTERPGEEGVGVGP